MRQVPGKKTQVTHRGQRRVVGDRTAGKFSDGKQGSLVGTKTERRGGAVQYPRRSLRAVRKPVDRAFVVARKRLITVE